MLGSVHIFYMVRYQTRENGGGWQHTRMLSCYFLGLSKVFAIHELPHSLHQSPPRWLPKPSHLEMQRTTWVEL